MGMKASAELRHRVSCGTIIGMLAVAVMVHWSHNAVAGPRPRFTVTDLGTLPGGYDTIPTKINNHGQVVGSTHTLHGLRVPFIYREGVMREIGIAQGGAALDVNDAGVVVGQIGTHAFTYRGDGVV